MSLRFRVTQLSGKTSFWFLLLLWWDSHWMKCSVCSVHTRTHTWTSLTLDTWVQQSRLALYTWPRPTRTNCASSAVKETWLRTGRVQNRRETAPHAGQSTCWLLYPALSKLDLGWISPAALCLRPTFLPTITWPVSSASMMLWDLMWIVLIGLLVLRKDAV